MKINLKQDEFCRNYVVLRDGTKAAIAAGYSPESAHVQASRLLRNDNVIQRIRELENEWRTNADISREQIIAELKAIAFGNIQDEAIVHDEQMYIPYDEEYIRNIPLMPRHVAATIKSVTVSAKGELNVQRYDKLTALSKLAEIAGLTGAADVNVNFSIADSIEEARLRAAEVSE